MGLRRTQEIIYRRKHDEKICGAVGAAVMYIGAVRLRSRGGDQGTELSLIHPPPGISVQSSRPARRIGFSYLEMSSYMEMSPYLGLMLCLVSHATHKVLMNHHFP